MSIIILFITLIIGLIFILVGFLIQKDPTLLSGYETLLKQSKDSKEMISKKIKIIAILFKIAGITMSILGSIASFINSERLFVLSIVFIPIVSCLLAIVVGNNKGRVFTKKNVLLACLAIIIPYSIYLFSAERPIYINDNSIQIKGTFGAIILKDSIENIILMDTLPHIVRRSNGFSLDALKIGTFQTAKNDIVHLYIYSSQPPFINIKLKSGEIYFINKKYALDTMNLYDELIEDK